LTNWYKIQKKTTVGERIKRRIISQTYFLDANLKVSKKILLQILRASFRKKKKKNAKNYLSGKKLTKSKTPGLSFSPKKRDLVFS
jgi:hypothetical protein